MVRFLLLRVGCNWHKNCLYIGTVLPFRRKSISVILGTVKTLHSSRSGLERLFSISVKGGGFYSLSKNPESAEQRAGRGQLFQYGGLHLHRCPAAGLHY